VPRAAWIAWIAGVAALLVVTGVVISAKGGAKGSVLTSNGLPPCIQEARLYGSAPAGYEYTPLRGADARDVLKDFELTDPEFGHVPVALAEGPGEKDFAVMIALKRKNAADDLGQFVTGAEQSGGKVTRSELRGRDVAWVKSADGGFVAAGEKGCHVVMLVSEREAVVRRLATPVLTGR
jgi:hypothetical protein